EKNLQFGLADVGRSIYNMHMAYADINTDNASTVLGDERDAPYASTYLLTEITTPDYIDRTGDGPTPDDFGGYTKFNYRRVAGANNKSDNANGTNWFHWRIPYNGMLYERNKISTEEDDLGMVSSGEKEVYYLQSIETKTHIAVFVTNKTFTESGRTFSGSGANRLDAFEASSDPSVISDPNATTAAGTNKLERLERVELYAKDTSGALGKLLQTTFFQYSYNLCRGLPNAAIVSGSRVGKLTLEKVWSETEGTVQARTTPYIFGYAYRDSSHYPSSIRDQYRSITNFASRFSSSEQNPDYKIFSTDRWGNYQADGDARHRDMNPWIDQTPDTTNFDPAAWQLKWIHLPSGGEIQVQYEQNDYQYVQDEPVAAMVRMKDNDNNNTNNAPSDEFYLDVEHDLGVTSAQDFSRIAALARQRFVAPPDGQREKIYFKILYSLDKDPPGLDRCMSEYIDGYASVAAIDTVTLYDGHRYLKVKVGRTSTYSHPEDACSDYIKHSAIQDVGEGAVCDNSRAGILHGDNVIDAVSSLVRRLGVPLYNPFSVAKRMDFEHSYMRLPMIRAKKGGGIRVKRLLTFDPGIQNTDPVLYGSEYAYQNEDGTSSGVATNEPGAGREENPLIKFVERRTDADTVDRIIAGKEKEKLERPIGESILPAPSIGYARIVMRNIHSGKTSTGISVNEYYTAKEFPFNREFIEVASDQSQPLASGDEGEKTPVDQQPDWAYVPAIVVNYRVNDVWATQGFRFLVNAMHGQPKRMATYTTDAGGFSNAYLSTLQDYSYFLPGEKVPMFRGVNDYFLDEPGKEMEVTFEDRSIEDVTKDLHIDIDPNVALFAIPIPFFTAAPIGGNYAQSKIRTHVTTKVMRYPAIVRSVLSYKDGVYHQVENVAFDPATGSPVVTRATDGYDKLSLQQSANHNGTYTSYAFPASQQYSVMGQKAGNERLIITSGGDSKFKIERRVASPTDMYLSVEFVKPGAVAEFQTLFVPGDIIRLTGTGGSQEFLGVFQVKELTSTRVILEPVSFNYVESRPVVDVNVEVIRSGRTNQLGESVGGITTYGTPKSPILCPGQ
ncbi:MAG: hypothetical protein ABI876_03985, partial [Bacteroidota bacterium]